MGIGLIILVVILILGGFILVGYFAKKQKGKTKKSDSTDVPKTNIPTKD